MCSDASWSIEWINGYTQINEWLEDGTQRIKFE